MNQAIRKLSGLLILPVLLAALLLPVAAKAEGYACTAELPVTVALNGNIAETFEVTIEGADPNQPMPAETKLQIAGNASASFTGIQYTEPGDYTYTVRQTAGSTAYMTYDKAVYTVVVQVTNAENGGLTYQVYASRDDNPTEKTGAIRFLNTYAPPAPAPANPTPTPTATLQPGIPQTGDNMPVGLWGAIAAAAVVVLAALVILRRRNHKQDAQH